MNPESLFGMAFAITPPWEVEGVEFSQKQDETLVRLSHFQLKTARAYQIKLALQNVYFAANRQDGEALLKGWYNWAIRSQIEQVRWEMGADRQLQV